MRLLAGRCTLSWLNLFMPHCVAAIRTRSINPGYGGSWSIILIWSDLIYAVQKRRREARKLTDSQRARMYVSLHVMRACCCCYPDIHLHPLVRPAPGCKADRWTTRWLCTYWAWLRLLQATSRYASLAFRFWFLFPPGTLRKGQSALWWWSFSPPP